MKAPLPEGPGPSARRASSPLYNLRASRRSLPREAAIEVEHLRRVYRTTVGVVRRRGKEVLAVDDLSFEVAPLLVGEFVVGTVYGLLGCSLFRWFEFQAKRRGTLEAF